MTPFQLGQLPGSSVGGVPTVAVLAVLGLAALVTGAFLRFQVDRARRGGSTAGGPDDTDRRRGSTVRPGNREPMPETPPEAVPDLLQTAAQRLSRADHDGAIKAAYMFCRVRLASRLDVPPEGTHWDFFDEVAAVGLGNDQDAFRELSVLYEQAVFGSQDLDGGEAERALALAAELTGEAPPRTV